MRVGKGLISKEKMKAYPPLKNSEQNRLKIAENMVKGLSGPLAGRGTLNLTHN